MKKALSILLCLAMLVPAFVACGDKTPVTTDPIATTDPVTDPAVTTVFPEMPEDHDTDGYAYNIYVFKNAAERINDFSTENSNFAVVNDAIFKRNEKVCEYLNCSIEYYEEVGSAFGSGPGYTKVRNDYTAAQASFDLCAVGSYDAPQLAKSKYVLDLKEIPYIDLSQSWWDQQANNDLCIAGRMYYTTGDISLSDNLGTHAVLFSKTMAAEKGIKDLYQLVEDKKWTFDKFTEYVRMVSEDLDGNDVMDVNDRFGLLCWNDGYQASVAGILGRICTVNSDGLIENTLYTERNETITQKVCDLFFDKSVSYNYQNNSVTSVSASVPDYFAEGHGLFYMTMFLNVPALRNADVDFGILPQPLYDENQEHYGAYMTSTHSVMYCIENFIEDEERVGAFMELSAYYSKVYVTPAYYEQTLKGRDVTDEESIVSLDIIFANRTFDVGILYMIGSYTGSLTNMIKAGTNTFTTIATKSEKAANKQINQINNSFSAATN